MKTKSGADVNIVYDPDDKVVNVEVVVNQDQTIKRLTIAELHEVFNHLKEIFPWLTEDQVYLMIPSRNVKSYNLHPGFAFFVPRNQPEPTNLPKY